jgi:purine-binding chemotaxis protein CheW
MIQLVSFELEGHPFGIDVRIVKEINPLVAITKVPRAPQTIRGLVNIRGQVVLVMDLAVIFGHAPREATSESQIVILKTDAELKNVRDREAVDIELGDKPVGFVVDRISDVISIPKREVEPVPPHLEVAQARFFDGVVGMNRELLMIMNAKEVLLSDRSTPPRRAELQELHEKGSRRG